MPTRAPAAPRTPVDGDPGRWRRLHTRLHRHPVSAALTKLAVTVLGVAALIGGAVMMVAPGPGVLGLVGGLALLGTEYPWARRLLTRLRDRLARARRAAAGSPGSRRRAAILGLAALALAGAGLLVALTLGAPLPGRGLVPFPLPHLRP